MNEYEQAKQIIYCSEVSEAAFWISLCFFTLCGIAVFQFVRALNQIAEGREAHETLVQIRKTLKQLSDEKK